MLSLEQRKRQQGGPRNRHMRGREELAEEMQSVVLRKDRAATPPWKKDREARPEIKQDHGLTLSDAVQWQQLRATKDKYLLLSDQNSEQHY